MYLIVYLTHDYYYYCIKHHGTVKHGVVYVFLIWMIYICICIYILCIDGYVYVKTGKFTCDIIIRIVYFIFLFHFISFHSIFFEY